MSSAKWRLFGLGLNVLTNSTHVVLVFDGLLSNMSYLIPNCSVYSSPHAYPCIYFPFVLASSVPDPGAQKGVFTF